MSSGNARVLACLILSGAATAHAQVTPLQIEHDVTVASMVSDRFTWQDSSGQPRVAVLAHNDNGAGPGGAAGGALRELRYQLSNGDTRIATVTTYGNAGYAGFGYVVSHSSRYAGCVGDDSPLGGFIAGHWQRIFEGRHHAIFRFTQNYPRNCPTTTPVQGYTMPVTIDWIFSTGRDNPVWAITYDVDLATPVGGGAAAPADTFYDDSRAPYGELNIDGDGTTDIDGTAWGDRYRFTSTGAPISLSSGWTWNTPNTVPWVKEWLNGPLGGGDVKNATMGLVQTQTMTRQDAGGARDPDVGSDITPLWTKTSLDFPNGVCSQTQPMPCPDDWPFQANGDSLFGGSNNNARLAWKTQYGFLGQTTYAPNDGVVASASGYPKKSYSVYVVLGMHTDSPVEAQLAQVETVQTVTLSASTGSVVTSGPAGVARADNVTLAPAGYNHVYGALAFNSSGNVLDANIAVGSGTLKKPLIIVGSYTGTSPQVILGGVTLTADVDYFASLSSSANELWITLNRDLTGATNHFQIALPSGVTPPAIGTPSVTNITATGATLKVNVTPNGSDTLVNFTYAASSTSTVDIGSGGAPVLVAQNVSGLTCGTQYSDQANATNGAGTFQSATQQFTTSACPVTHGFFVVTPCRLFDSRNANGPFGGPALGAGAVRNVLAASQCGIAADATAVAINVTATNASSSGWLTIFPGPAGGAVPFVSTINYQASRVIANNAIVPIGAGGTINVYNSGPFAVNGIIDVNGFFK